jgi:hypothetical protein
MRRHRNRVSVRGTRPARRGSNTDIPTDEEQTMTRVPDEELVLIPGSTLITATPEEGRALALRIARHTVHNIQPDLDILKGGRPNYATNPDSLTAATQVVAIEFQTIAAANNYWRPAPYR